MFCKAIENFYFPEICLKLFMPIFLSQSLDLLSLFKFNCTLTIVIVLNFFVVKIIKSHIFSYICCFVFSFYNYIAFFSIFLYIVVMLSVSLYICNSFNMFISLSLGKIFYRSRSHSMKS